MIINRTDRDIIRRYPNSSLAQKLLLKIRFLKVRRAFDRYVLPLIRAIELLHALLFKR